MNLLKLCRMMSDYKKGELYYVEKIIPAVAVLSTITFSSVFAAPPSQNPAEQNRYIDVQMLGINDLHGQLDTVKKSIIKKLVALIT